MNMKLKSTLVASVLAFAVAGPANAAIVDMSTGSSDLVLNIWDTTSSTSYTEDLGINMSSFMAGVTGTTAATLAASALPTGDHTFAPDALLTSFLSTATLGTTFWSVTAGDNVGTSGFQQKNYLTTSTGTTMPISNTVLLSGGGNASNYFSLMNTVTGANPDALGSGTTYAGASGAAGGGWGNKWVNTSTLYGNSLNFLYMTPSSTSTVAAAGVAAFKGAGGVNSYWTLNTSPTGALGTLTFTAPVPEPGEWALMLSGFGLIGFIALRRKNTGMTFA
ncbi:MAG TPA: PEP-CTERM sorting domain-containing protein [Gallionella sp.]|nr:PEP-CTERM sorting domain-containing protein [Gallionella sp.]